MGFFFNSGCSLSHSSNQQESLHTVHNELKLDQIHTQCISTGLKDRQGTIPPNFPALVKLCQSGMCCILLLTGSCRTTCRSRVTDVQRGGKKTHLFLFYKNTSCLKNVSGPFKSFIQAHVLWVCHYWYSNIKQAVRQLAEMDSQKKLRLRNQHRISNFIGSDGTIGSPLYSLLNW